MLRFIAIVALVLLASLAVVSASNEASDYKDCESCVENGWGWSWSKGLCGGYLNTNCDPESADALDEEEDEDFASQASNLKADTPPVDDTPFQIPDPAPAPTEPLEWRNTEQTTHLWQLANAGDLQSLASWVYREPGVVHLRAEDGRGPLFWANEYEKWDMIDFLLERGADPEASDAQGNKPADLLPAGAKRPKNVKSVDSKQAAAQAKAQQDQIRAAAQQAKKSQN